jgi:hypothetical protein
MRFILSLICIKREQKVNKIKILNNMEDCKYLNDKYAINKRKKKKMGKKIRKKYCDVGKKWCKFLRKGVCNFSDCELCDIVKCPRIAEIETMTLYNLIREVNFDEVFSRVCFYFPSQSNRREGYENAFNELLDKKQNKHLLGDLFINVDIVENSLDVTGLNTKSGVHYGIEFCKWSDWVTMFITKETLDRLSKEDIVAGCLYEMTFFGFTENKVLGERDKMVDDIKKMKNKDEVS